MITRADLVSHLNDLGIRAGDTICVHASLQRSTSIEGANGGEKVLNILDSLKGAVGSSGLVVMPTFTYSFCNGERFDVEESPSTVGLLTERFRLAEGVVRTPDPIFSSALSGEVELDWTDRLFNTGPYDCFGKDSIFAYLLAADAWLVFFDVSFEFCTFIHHVEQSLGVPYRYPKRFRGEVRWRGSSFLAYADFFVRRLDEDVETYLTPLWERLVDAGAGRSSAIPRGPTIRAVRAHEVAGLARDALAHQPDFLLKRGHELGT